MGMSSRGGSAVVCFFFDIAFVTFDVELLDPCQYRAQADGLRGGATGRVMEGDGRRSRWCARASLSAASIDLGMHPKALASWGASKGGLVHEDRIWVFFVLHRPFRPPSSV
jgi:hypothetical protein